MFSPRRRRIPLRRSKRVPRRGVFHLLIPYPDSTELSASARGSPASLRDTAEKKARIARIRAYRNYCCHAVLMALGLTDAGSRGSRRFRPVFCNVTLQVLLTAARGAASGVSTSSRVQSRLTAPRRIAMRRFRPRAHVARNIAAQVAARRGRREVAAALGALLPGLDGSRAIGPPVPALRALLGERRCGH